ncbi:hypothetical protein MRS44_017175 [Fusarium solani]|uniref:Opsin-like protein carO n=1 Tax=Fusarium solani TaxID=169388 RepID=A0A9P9GRI7_FUSSL|nr:uncharacterized protein B0J15DRAFT_515496 [Fusarium solani]KAH7243846.1 hypothetical protein B0J15DRAFT_515496 [Fusarium solani]KAJ3455693.1 hypothetical protein MRS44_017175 [Fusarium solani]
MSTTYQVVGRDGMRALWIVFGIMVIASAVFALRSSTIIISRRLYHVITTLTTIISALSYFAMASGHAAAFICQMIREGHKHVPDIHRHVCREVFWARFVDWSLSTPLLLLELCLLAGIDGAHTLMAIVAVLIIVLSGLFAAFGRDNTAQTWGWFAIACVSYLLVIWYVAVYGSKTVDARGAKVTKLFSSMVTFILILWTIYPIVWGIADGAKKISVDSAIIAYAVLDVLTKPVFGAWLLIAHHQIPEINVEVGGYWSEGLSSERIIRIGDNEEAPLRQPSPLPV